MPDARVPQPAVQKVLEGLACCSYQGRVPLVQNQPDHPMHAQVPSTRRRQPEFTQGPACKGCSGYGGARGILSGARAPGPAVGCGCIEGMPASCPLRCPGPARPLFPGHLASIINPLLIISSDASLQGLSKSCRSMARPV
ncbi:hypothetical protein NDU88_001255 [Pleurodeles waltl]|uniref:Uncharacterized protein n=1 Tax=Pleurodeles waltl TaxID=8319 RepID=A0AAV7MMX6_PLEWA|nr:hypothetical protein NDU88_001255 [Pleurodeles waltl]